MQDRPETTLFMLISVDGKITTGDSDDLDTDTDFRKITGIKEGLQQYYDLEKKTDRFSLNTGRVMAKIGVNTDRNPIHCPDVNFIVVDNKPHLNDKGVKNLLDNLNKLYLVTTNKNHPAFKVSNQAKNLEIIVQPGKINFVKLFFDLKQKFKINRVTIQSGGTLNATLVREKLIDHVSVVVAPALIGGKDTSSLIDGESLHKETDLEKIKALKLISSRVLDDSYVHLYYDVINETRIIDSK